MFSIPSHAFKVPITISDDDIDIMNHVNNVVYFRWVQEVATAHWVTICPPDQLLQWAWVVGRHEIDYLRPCFRNDTVAAYTWVIPKEGMGSDRIVVFKNENTGKVITQVKTTWYLVDPVSQRSRTIPPEIFGWLGI